MGKLCQSRLFGVFVLFLVILLMGCGGGAREREGGTIFGYVHDPVFDGPFVGAEVTASKDGSKKLVFTTTTDKSGNYTLLNLPPGTYTVNFTHERSFPYLIKNVNVNEGGKKKVDVTLVVSFGGT